jgi:hypothetical protein
MFEDPALQRLRAAMENGACTPFTREDCLGELARVLAYASSSNPERQAEIAAAYRARCTRSTPSSTRPASCPPASTGTTRSFSSWPATAAPAPC